MSADCSGGQEAMFHFSEGYRLSFEELLSRFEGKIYCLALHLTGSGSDAEQILSSTFSGLSQELQTFATERKLEVYLIRAAIASATQLLEARSYTAITRPIDIFNRYLSAPDAQEASASALD